MKCYLSKKFISDLHFPDITIYGFAVCLTQWSLEREVDGELIRDKLEGVAYNETWYWKSNLVPALTLKARNSNDLKLLFESPDDPYKVNNDGDVISSFYKSLVLFYKSSESDSLREAIYIDLLDGDLINPLGVTEGINGITLKLGEVPEFNINPIPEGTGSIEEGSLLSAIKFAIEDSVYDKSHPSTEFNFYLSQFKDLDNESIKVKNKIISVK